MREYFEKLYKGTVKDFQDAVNSAIDNEDKLFIVTANPETFSYGESNEDFNKLLTDKSVTLVPDGISIVKASKMLEMPCAERITGVDLASYLFEVANNKKLNIALLGAKEEIIGTLVNKLKRDYPAINIVAYQNGYEENKDRFFDDIKNKDVDICLVALGIPSQELLIYNNLNKFNKGIFVGVGGSFDVLSGIKKRAPKCFQKLNIEWLYRIIKEPKRIKRFYNNNVKFMFKVMRLNK